MPLYAFRGMFCAQYGEVRKEFFPISDPPQAIFEPETGFYGVRDYETEHGGVTEKPIAGWPLHCEASGCHPEQREEFQRDSIARGVPTEFDRHGRAIFRNRQHRKAYHQARGIFDRSGGYGDASPP